MTAIDPQCKCQEPKGAPVKRAAPKKGNKLQPLAKTPKKIVYDRWKDNARLKFLAIPNRRSKYGRFDCELDLVLNTCYEHNEELFPEKTDVYFQSNTIESMKSSHQVSKPKTDLISKSAIYSKHSFVQLTRASIIKQPMAYLPGEVDHENIKKEQLPIKFIEGYPLIIGGIVERIHPCSIKLMNSSHHSPQTNAGYVRQDRDGILFQY